MEKFQDNNKFISSKFDFEYPPTWKINDRNILLNPEQIFNNRNGVIENVSLSRKPPIISLKVESRKNIGVWEDKIDLNQNIVDVFNNLNIYLSCNNTTTPYETTEVINRGYMDINGVIGFIIYSVNLGFVEDYYDNDIKEGYIYETKDVILLKDEYSVHLSFTKSFLKSHSDTVLIDLDEEINSIIDTVKIYDTIKNSTKKRFVGETVILDYPPDWEETRNLPINDHDYDNIWLTKYGSTKQNISFHLRSYKRTEGIGPYSFDLDNNNYETLEQHIERYFNIHKEDIVLDHHYLNIDGTEGYMINTLEKYDNGEYSETKAVIILKDDVHFEIRFSAFVDSTSESKLVGVNEDISFILNSIRLRNTNR